MDQRSDPITGLVLRFVELVRESGIQVEAAYLYGSHATGNAHADSDVDVAIVSPQLSGSISLDWKILAPLRRKVDLRIEPIGFRPEQFCDENPLVWEIKQKGLRIV